MFLIISRLFYFHDFDNEKCILIIFDNEIHGQSFVSHFKLFFILIIFFGVFSSLLCFVYSLINTQRTKYQNLLIFSRNENASFIFEFKKD